MSQDTAIQAEVESTKVVCTEYVLESTRAVEVGEAGLMSIDASGWLVSVTRFNAELPHTTP